MKNRHFRIKKKSIILFFIFILLVLLFSLFLHIIAGGIPKIEYAFNTRYSDDFSNEVFQSITKGDDLDDILERIGKPIFIKKYVIDKEYFVYHYSDIKKGRKIGVVAHIYAKMIIVCGNKVVGKIDEILPSYKLKSDHLLDDRDL